MNTGEHTVALDVSEGGPWLSDLLSGAGSKGHQPQQRKQQHVEMSGSMMEMGIEDD